MLFSLRSGTLCVPVDDCLIGDTVRVVQHLEQLPERLHESCIGITVYLGRVDQSDLGFCAFTERLENGCSGLELACDARNREESVR
jgi:hypothetical protein